jgi:transcriptional regulator with XRE-family HTH domain
MTGKELRERFSYNLKRLRAKHGISQLSLATRVGLAHNFINDIENGRKWVSPESIVKFSNALDEDPHQLFLPERPNSSSETASLDAYLDEVSDSILLTVQELKSRYHSEK